MSYDPEKITNYVKWLLSLLDEIKGEDIDKSEVRVMLLSVIGEVYRSGVDE